MIQVWISTKEDFLSAENMFGDKCPGGGICPFPEIDH